MKHAAAVLVSLLLLCHLSAVAAGFRLELGHVDPAEALTLTPETNTFLPDGCLGQVILDMADNGIAAPCVDGSPGEGDVLLTVAQGLSRQVPVPVTFTVNGTEQLDMPGCFLSAAYAGNQIPSHRIYLRVWNAPTPDEATGHWDSPLYEILAGPQQVSFTRQEWCWTEFSSLAHKENSGLVTQSALGAFPNPFNSTSRISFDLPETGPVQLAVYDLQGRLVNMLANGELGRGHHDLSFDGGALPSGLYFLRLQVGRNAALVKRLLLLR